MEGLAPAEVLDLDLVRLAVLEVGNHLVHLEVESESSGESRLEEERACHSADSEVERHLVEREEMACRDRQEVEDRLASQKVGEACLLGSAPDRTSGIN